MKIPVSKLKRSMTSTQFVKYKVQMLEEANEFNPLYYYLAAIVAAVERGYVKNPKKVTIQGRLLKFFFKKDKEKEVEVSAPALDARGRLKAALAPQKAMWKALLGGAKKLTTRMPPKKRKPEE
jgi:hypothetical protein